MNIAKEIKTMKDLKVIESGLVPVYEDKQSHTVINARELHEFLDSRQEFANWIKSRIEKYSFVEGEDYLIILSNRSGGTAGKPRTDYFLTIDCGKELAMVENNEKGRMVRKYFIDCEKRLHSKANQISAANNEKLSLQRERIEIMRQNARNRQAQILKSVADDFMEILSKESIQSIASHVTVLTAGERLIELPIVEKSYTAKDVGDICGISANMVGRLANLHEMKNDLYGKTVLDKSPYGSKLVPTFRYNQHGVDKIRELVASGAVSKAADLNKTMG